MKFDYFYIVIMGKYVDGENLLFYIKLYLNEMKIFLYFIMYCIFLIMKVFFLVLINVECDNYMKVG